MYEIQINSFVFTVLMHCVKNVFINIQIKVSTNIRPEFRVRRFIDNKVK